MLWLTELKQAGGDVVIDGRCTTLTGLSEFVSNLEASGYFKRSIEIVDTRSEVAGTPPAEVIRFTIKAVFQQPGEAAKPAPVAKAGG
jgi:Tfp pilus assembly protein PilN